MPEFDPDAFMAERKPAPINVSKTASTAFDPDAFMQKQKALKEADLTDSPEFRFAKGAFDAVNPGPGIKAALTTNPATTLGELADRQVGMFPKAADAFKRGDYTTAAAKGIEGLIPLVGPQVGEAFDQMRAGNTAGGLGSLTGVGATLAAPEATKLAGRGATSLAGDIAESAVGARQLDRAYGRTPGPAILNETSAVNPGSIAEQARAKISGLTNELQTKASASTVPVDLTPSLKTIDDAIARAKAKNNRQAMEQLQAIRNHLTIDDTDPANPRQISPSVSATDALNLKRGLTDKFVTRWNPDTMSGVKGAAAKAYRAIDQQFDAAVPDGAELNQRISSLIPVAKRAEAADMKASPAQNIMNTLVAPTGALAGTIAGTMYGGVPGGIAGAVLPKLVGTPTGQMLGARGLAAGGKLLKSPYTGRALQIAPYLPPDLTSPEDQ